MLSVGWRSSLREAGDSRWSLTLPDLPSKDQPPLFSRRVFDFGESVRHLAMSKSVKTKSSESRLGKSGHRPGR